MAAFSLTAAKTNKVVFDRYMRLTQPKDKVMTTYIWVDYTGEHLMSKTRTIDFVPKTLSQLPIWNYVDICNKQQGEEGKLTDRFLHPVTMYNDPFNMGNNKLVLCETYAFKCKPTVTNHRRSCLEAMELAADHEPWFGIEQEYTLLENDMRPLGWPKYGFPGPRDAVNVCSVGANRVFGRDIADAHYRAALYAGVKICGSNAEAMSSMWEFQVGPCEGISMGDDLWMARYILHRVAEDFSVIASFDTKAVEHEYGTAGAHCNFSTKKMREENGIVEIEKAIEKLSRCHAKHIKAYDPHEGKDNERRLIDNGLTTSSIHEFSAGVNDRACSIRVPLTVAEERKGYLEDRRPASNCDPYKVTEALVRTTLLPED